MTFVPSSTGPSREQLVGDGTGSPGNHLGSQVAVGADQVHPSVRPSTFAEGEGVVYRPTDMLGLLPWVSMAEALGDLAPAEFIYDPRQSWGDQERRSTLPAPTVTAAAGGKGVAVLRATRLSNGCARPVSEPAMTIPDAGTDKPIALTEPQGCRLMAFPDGTDAALCGTKQDRWRIIGNAVCPPVGHAVLSTLIGVAA